VLKLGVPLAIIGLVLLVKIAFDKAEALLGKREPPSK
jgi:hypothetical protein